MHILPSLNCYFVALYPSPTTMHERLQTMPTHFSTPDGGQKGTDVRQTCSLVMGQIQSVMGQIQSVMGQIQSVMGQI